MPQPAKYIQVMSTLERRVRAGDYLLREIPGERRIAEETGVSYMTARRAVAELLEQEVLVRQPNGALAVHPRLQPDKQGRQLVLLVPDFPSPFLAKVRQMIAEQLTLAGSAVRTVHFVHWEDPAIVQAVTEADGAIIIPPAKEIPVRVADRLRRARVVVVGRDLSGTGFPSIDPFPARHLSLVLQRVAALGHVHVDCVNTQPLHDGIHHRIQLWRDWLDQSGARGCLWDRPTPSYTDPTENAYAMIAEALQQRQLHASALVCTTFPAALAVSRALWERGRQVGRDVSVVAMNVEPPARYCCPSIAGLELPDLAEHLRTAQRWFSGGADWRGPLLLEPQQAVFFDGESLGTVATPDSQSRSAGSSPSGDTTRAE